MAACIIYNAAISPCGKGDRGQQALNLLSWTTQAKIAADAITCSANGSAYEKGGRWRIALN